MKHASLVALVALVVLIDPSAGRAQAAQSGGAGALNLDVTRWQVVTRESGPVNYYHVVADPSLPFVHAEYTPPEATAVLGVQIGDSDRKRARALSWQWRAVTLPQGGDECASGKGDSAAVVYLTWKHTLKWYTLKYVWSSVGQRGAVCDRKRNPFVAQDTVILQSGGPLGAWRNELIDLKQEFRRHFGDGDPNAEVPDFVGIGIMTDGDQTKSASSADYADFVLQR
jgi:Protein of unknown function (DUF3047)